MSLRFWDLGQGDYLWSLIYLSTVDLDILYPSPRSSNSISRVDLPSAWRSKHCWFVRHRGRYQWMRHCPWRGWPWAECRAGWNEWSCLRDILCLNQVISWGPPVSRVLGNPPCSRSTDRARNVAESDAAYLLAHAVCVAVPQRYAVRGRYADVKSSQYLDALDERSQTCVAYPAGPFYVW